MSEHTPGPWSFDGDFIRGPDGRLLPEFWRENWARRDADARLQAAAPELLEVAEQAQLEYSGQVADAMRRGRYGEEAAWRQRWQQARTAIAKAKGESDE